MTKCDFGWFSRFYETLDDFKFVYYYFDFVFSCVAHFTYLTYEYLHAAAHSHLNIKNDDGDKDENNQNVHLIKQTKYIIFCILLLECSVYIFLLYFF